MGDFTSVENMSEVNRRHLIRSAAWATPAVMLASSAPLAAASISNATLAFTTSNSAGSSFFPLIGSQGSLQSTSPIVVPTDLTITNGTGALAVESCSVTIVVTRPSASNPPTTQARGFGVYSLDWTQTQQSERTVKYEKSFGRDIGFPNTTLATTIPAFNVPSNGTHSISLTMGLVGASQGAHINGVATFTVHATVRINGKTNLTATTQILVPVDSGIL